MKRKLISILLCVVMAAALLIGCGKDKNETQENDRQNVEENTKKEDTEKEDTKKDTLKEDNG